MNPIRIIFFPRLPHMQSSLVVAQVSASQQVPTMSDQVTPTFPLV
uniref:Uncharacterized protein n=1 Tax=Ciona intestinalis TaxID=7719 RepID=F6U2K0_CIOIN